MRLALLLIGGLVCLTSGCTSGRLRQRTINQARTLSGLQYEQVLDNLAQFAANPGALPWHVNLREGTSQVTDSLSGGALVDLSPPASTEPQLFGSRTVVAQWGMAPVIDATELRLLAVAYRRACGSPEMPAPEFLEELAHELKDQQATNADVQQETGAFFGYQTRDNRSLREFDSRVLTTNDDGLYAGPSTIDRDASPLVRDVRRKVDVVARDLAAIRPGWFHVGRRRDVPKDACYVGHDGDRYVWVCADGRAALTEFTLTVLKLASLIKETETLINPGSVKFSPGDRGG